MESLPSVKQIAMYAWCTVFVILSIFIVEHSTNAQAWTQDIQPTLKIKYGKCRILFYPILLCVRSKNYRTHSKHIINHRKFMIHEILMTYLINQ